MTAATKNKEMRIGGCLCGAVRFQARLKSLDVGVCHCGMCRRWSGGTFMAVEVETDWEQTGTHKAAVYVSSDWGQRLFCEQCGTTIGWQFRDGSSLSLAVPSFDSNEGFNFTTEIYIDKKPGFYEFANHTRKFTEAEIIAQFVKQGS